MNINISSDFNFRSNYIEVNGSKMHYIDQGEGDPILFLHGNPTSSYLWRNIIPFLIPHGRCIAPDLIGMGKSDKPDIDYRFTTHYQYLEKFIQQLDLKDITLVIHDWGSGLGFHYASLHEDNIKGIAFMEAILKTAKWSDFPPSFKTGFKLMRTSGIGWFMISVMNFFVNKILPKATLRSLSESEMRMYNAPYPTVKSRKPLRQWPREIPIEGKPADVNQVVNNYREWLKSSSIPKLLLYAKPGGLIHIKKVEQIVNNFPNTSSAFIGKGLHYIQEDNPENIGKELKKWVVSLPQ